MGPFSGTRAYCPRRFGTHFHRHPGRGGPSPAGLLLGLHDFKEKISRRQDRLRSSFGAMTVATAREIAVRVLEARENGGDYTEDLLARELASANLGSQDRGLAQELAYGAVRWQATLDYLIQRKAPQPITKPVLRILLRLGLYQLFWLERIPDHAAVNEAVTLCKRLGYPRQSGFINAILRAYLREREHTERLLSELKGYQPPVGYSHPAWLFERWEKRWGQEAAVKLLDWNNTPPKSFARLNTLRTDQRQLLEAWKAEGVVAQPIEKPWTPPGLLFALESHPSLAKLPSFQQGYFYVQDPSTLLAVHALDPQPGDSILDLCAAPGGKATYMAQLTGNRGHIVAEDLDPGRLALVRENCVRLGAENVEIRSTEEGRRDLATQFDRILIDAPCSNTGVMRRRVDLRWRIRAEEIQKLSGTQLALLRRAAPQLKPGGCLVYSTCSLEPEENRETVNRFLAEHSDFQLRSEREILPFVEQVDGAYVATLDRASRPQDSEPEADSDFGLRTSDL